MRLDKLYKKNNNPHLFEDERRSTNCGSFALNVTEWYTPYIVDSDHEVDEDNELYIYAEEERAAWMYELLAEGWSREDVMTEITLRDFEFILKTCPWLVPIEEEEINENDRIIAYRLSLEVPGDLEDFDVDDCSDFHFRVLIDGEWWEKNGASEVHKVANPQEETWPLDDWLIYDGPIKYAKFREVW